MALNKSNLSVTFAQGLDTKTDPFQVTPGKFLRLSNTVFNNNGLLQKRPGYQSLLPPASGFVLPGASGSAGLTTFKGNLISNGTSLNALLRGESAWINQGPMRPMSLSVIPLARPTNSQTTTDTAINTSINLICSVWTDSASNVYYQLQDLNTGQLSVAPTQIVSAASPRVFVLGNYFVITYNITITATVHLRYIAIPVNNPNNPSVGTDISTQVNGSVSAYDGVVTNNSLYLSWNGSDGGSAIRMSRLSNTLTQSSTVVLAGYNAINISVCADTSGNSPVIYTSFLAGTTLYATAYSASSTQILAPVTLATGITDLNQITSIAINGILTVLWQTTEEYSYVSKRSDFVTKITMTAAGVVGTSEVLLRGVGIASKAFVLDDVVYVMVVYGSANSGLLQPSYFLTDMSRNIGSKLAYSNAGPYYTTQVLPSVFVNENTAQISYLRKDFISSVNPENLTPPSSTSNIYSQTGVDLATFNFLPDFSTNREIGHNLHFSGGYVVAYDGTAPVEQNFFIYPEDILGTWSNTGGSMSAQPDGVTNADAYYYQVTYEWTDAQGNIHRSAPSVPVAVTTTSNGNSGSITLNIPTLRLSYKPNVRICIYRWSVAQQNYFQVTSIISPTLNNPNVDSITFTDTLADSSILGNSLIYTTGGVIENISPPATDTLALFKSRLFLVDAENRNTLWYSKQVIQGVPVEMSDLLTIFIAPTEGAQGSTGDITALAPMDDKLIIFKADAIYYLTGNGPDNTGGNNDFAQPVFITSTVGTINPNMVLTPQGLMFQSDKGIWLLGRDLSTNYIGAPVEAFNSFTVTSANTIPGTNYVLFTLDGNVTLMYDYYYGQWGTFSITNILSATLYQGMHTFLNSYGELYQQTTDSYLDGASPVLIGFTTGWMSLAGLQGFQRAYYFYLLGVYHSPHFLNMQLAYDFGSPSQSILINPLNNSSLYGGDNLYGGGAVNGGSASLEQFRIFFERQRCQSFQISLDEVFNSSAGFTAGLGLTISGLNLVVGVRKGYVPVPANQSVG